MTVDFIVAALLGIVQGLTEFLPISSTAHLTIAENVLLGESLPLAFDVLMHAGTLVALMVYFRHELVKVVMGLIGRNPEGARLAWLLFIAMSPTGILAMSTKPFKEAAKGHAWLYGVFLVVTAAMLWGANYLAKRRQGRAMAEMNILDALCIGGIQGLGGGFGLSRSGSTISVGVFRGINLSESTRFSFLLGIPTIAAAAIVEGGHLVKDMLKNDGVGQAAWFSGASNPILLSIVGICAAGVSGYFALGLLDRFTSKPRLGGFVIYCFVVGVAIIALHWGLPAKGL
ncbi:MAG: undecaprenyl-diphosphate phosphatase [Holophagales bacterium]|jgi:undecaprenyl-diphosphatase|nr:undecaprenyl-diphosphate phosphatase [Holophagales bacterium]